MPNRLATWAMLLWTGLMGAGIFAAFLGIGEDCRALSGAAASTCQADAWVRGGVGLSLLLFLWFVVFVPMALVSLFTRPKANVTVFGPDGQQVMLSESEARRRVASGGWTYERPERPDVVAT